MKANTPNTEKTNYRKVELFLGGLNAGEYKYLQLTMNVVEGVKHLIDNYKLTKEDIISTFKIKPTKFLAFITGNYNYSLMDIARIQAKCVELEVKRAEENKGKSALNLEVASTPIPLSNPNNPQPKKNGKQKKNTKKG